MGLIKRRVETSLLNVETEISGPPSGPVVVLLDGWPAIPMTCCQGLGHLPQREAAGRTAGSIVDRVRQFNDVGASTKIGI